MVGNKSSVMQENAELRLRIRSLESKVSELEKLVRIDTMTGIGNKQAYREILEEESGRMRRDLMDGKASSEVALLFFDLDGFKKLNDTKGHEEGDAALKLFASILQSHSRKGYDVPIRYGGDEFVVIMKRGTHEAAERYAKKVADELERYPDINASFGIATLSEAEGNADALVRMADRRMYSMKRELKGILRSE